MNNSIQIWKQSLSDAKTTLEKFISEPGVFEKLDQITNLMAQTFENGGTVFSCGNGGSHCDAMHFAEEWTGRYRKDRKPMGALALGDASHVTCVSNDFGFEQIFARQLTGLGRPGDLLLVLSTSGNSKNQILAVEAARQKGIKTIGFLGRDGGKMKSLVDLAVIVPAQTSDRIQEVHIKLIHTLIEAIENRLFPELYRA